MFEHWRFGVGAVVVCLTVCLIVADNARPQDSADQAQQADQNKTFRKGDAFIALRVAKLIGDEVPDWGDARGNVIHIFDRPARFDLPQFDHRRIRESREGVVIYEGMRISKVDDYIYEARFVASAPTMPVTIRLQFEALQKDHLNRVVKRCTITLPPIELDPQETVSNYYSDRAWDNGPWLVVQTFYARTLDEWSSVRERRRQFDSAQLSLASGGPSPHEQFMLELINRARLSPPTAAARVVAAADPGFLASRGVFDLETVRREISAFLPAPPLAWSQELANAARDHSKYKADNGSPTETPLRQHLGSSASANSTPEDRIKTFGYPPMPFPPAENVHLWAKSVEDATDAFLIDWGNPTPAHRKTLFDPKFTEVGIGLVNTVRREIGPIVATQDFARKTNVNDSYLVGVAYEDLDGNGFYSPGEGRANVTITASRIPKAPVKEDTTGPAGCYQMLLQPGLYEVTARVGSMEVRAPQKISVGNQNLKLDFELTRLLPPRFEFSRSGTARFGSGPPPRQ